MRIGDYTAVQNVKNNTFSAVSALRKANEMAKADAQAVLDSLPESKFARTHINIKV